MMRTAAALALSLFVLPVAPARSAAGQQRAADTAIARALDAGLIAAVNKGDVNEVVDLLNAGADVNAKVAGDGSPLIAAAASGSMHTVRLLLERGAEINTDVPGDGNALIAAARGGHVEIVALLLDRGADIDHVVPGDENALIQACAEGRLEVVRLLIARGANASARVSADVYESETGIVSQEWRTPLSMARRGNHAAVVRYLLSLGALD